tara:strand:- start:242 stop:859 length:618 start_codon:yes stop_codon:yes gene_type:complete
MSQIKLLHSGGNGVSIVAPDSNPASDRTLKLPSNADGTILTTTNPKAGNIIQVVSFTKTNAASASITQDTNWTGHGVAVNITPSSASNKIIISGYITVGNDRNDGIFGIAYKNGSPLTSAIGDQGVSSGTRATTGVEIDYNFVVTPIPVYFIDTAGATTQQTYTMALNITTSASSTVYVNRPQTSDNYVWNATTISVLTAMEIAA